MEVMLIVTVVAISLLSLLKLMSTSTRALTETMVNLNAQASAEDLLQQIRLMRWDQLSRPGVRVDLTTTPSAEIVCTTCNIPRQTIEDWWNYSDTDPARPRFLRRVRVEFVRLRGDRLVKSNKRRDRKRVTVWAWDPTGTSSATVTSVFYNLP